MQHLLIDINIASVSDVHFAVEMSKFNGIAKPYRKCIWSRTELYSTFYRELIVLENSDIEWINVRPSSDVVLLLGRNLIESRFNFFFLTRQKHNSDSAVGLEDLSKKTHTHAWHNLILIFIHIYKIFLWPPQIADANRRGLIFFSQLT